MNPSSIYVIWRFDWCHTVKNYSFKRCHSAGLGELCTTWKEPNARWLDREYLPIIIFWYQNMLFSFLVRESWWRPRQTGSPKQKVNHRLFCWPILVRQRLIEEAQLVICPSTFIFWIGNICVLVERLSSVTSVKLKFILILNHIIAGSGLFW